MIRTGIVLVVDDDVAVLQMTCEVLERCGLTAVSLTSVADAMSFMAQNPGATRALFTDINLATPMSGIELAIFVAQEWPDVAIAVTSGVAKERPKRLPACASYLPKPWATVDLIAFAEQAMRDNDNAV